MDEIRRGDIWYIDYSGDVIGSEQDGGRPGIVVSNDICNRFSLVIEVVFLTTARKKRRLPTHVDIQSAPRKSIALCEQITSVSTDRLVQWMGCLSEEEMAEVDRALICSLGIEAGS